MNDEASVRKALTAIAADGALHGLVNNAGIHLEAPSHEMDTATYERVMQTNATAVFTTCREAYPYLVQAGGGDDRQHRLVLRQDRRQTQPRLLRIQGGGGRDDALPGGRMGIQKHTRARHRARATSSPISIVKRSKAGPYASISDKRIPGGRPGTARDVARLVAAIFTEDIPFLSGETIYIDGGQGIAH